MRDLDTNNSEDVRVAMNVLLATVGTGNLSLIKSKLDIIFNKGGYCDGKHYGSSTDEWFALLPEIAKKAWKCIVADDTLKVPFNKNNNSSWQISFAEKINIVDQAINDKSV